MREWISLRCGRNTGGSSRGERYGDGSGCVGELIHWSSRWQSSGCSRQ